jgi:transketolase
MYAPKHKLNNLIVVVDKNGNQINDSTSNIMPTMDTLTDKYQAFGWQTAEINGHDFNQILKAFRKAFKSKGPFAIISNTVTGKGISFMEGDYHWHHGLLTDELYQQALKDLK